MWLLCDPARTGLCCPAAQNKSSSLQTTTVVGVLHNNDESAYTAEVKHLVDQCQDNSLALDVHKTKEMVVDFRKDPAARSPLSINGCIVETVSSVKFLGMHVAHNLPWRLNTTCNTKKTSAAAESRQPRPSHPPVLLPRCHREHPLLLHHRRTPTQDAHHPLSRQHSGGPLPLQQQLLPPRSQAP